MKTAESQMVLADCFLRKTVPITFGGGSFLCVAILFHVLALSPTLAQVSLVDSSFKVGGSDKIVRSLVVQSDQRILVGGEFTCINGQSNSYLTRLNSDGSVDASFSSQGGTDGKVFCLLLETDGSTLVGGIFSNLLGKARLSLGRLTPDGVVDLSFDPSVSLNADEIVLALARQEDGKILVSAANFQDPFRIIRLKADGTQDPVFCFTNSGPGYASAFVPLADGGTLVGLNPMTATTNTCLIRLEADGRLDPNFNLGFWSNSCVLALARKPNGQILVGGQLWRNGSTKPTPLLQLNADFTWDDTFPADSFKPQGADIPVVWSILLQPDGKIVTGGRFFEVGGYYRRHIVRLSSAGKVDGCFDPGLGFGGFGWEHVLGLAVQTNGSIIAGGLFYGFDGVSKLQNIARLYPQSSCDAMRICLGEPELTSGRRFVVGTFPPGGTNLLEYSTNLVDWKILARDTSPVVYVESNMPIISDPKAFFRARQEH